MESQDLELPKLVYTCGICETILEIQEVQAHGCFANYVKIIADDNHYLFPQCDNGDIVRRRSNSDEAELLPLDEGRNAKKTAFSHSGTTPATTDATTLEEIIIGEVFSRELLWNVKIAITKRDRRTIQKLWEEVAKATNGACGVEDVKKKWKNLRDRFMKLVALEKLPSGSAANPSKRRWIHYGAMSFLRDSFLHKPTVTNMLNAVDVDVDNEAQDVQEDSENAEDISPSLTDASSTPKESKKRRRSGTVDEQDGVLRKIAEALSSPQPGMSLPAPVVLDEVDNFTSIIGTRLREFPQRRQRKLMFEMYKFINDAFDEDG